MGGFGWDTQPDAGRIGASREDYSSDVSGRQEEVVPAQPMSCATIHIIRDHSARGALDIPLPVIKSPDCSLLLTNKSS